MGGTYKSTGQPFFVGTICVSFCPALPCPALPAAPAVPVAKSAVAPCCYCTGLGFHKPHLPWHFPKKYWDNTPENPPVAKHQAFPSDVPALGWHECAECSSWSNPANTSENGRIAYFNTDGEGMPLPNQKWQSNMRRGYYAAISCKPKPSDDQAIVW
jgi:hypothetical protein